MTTFRRALPPDLLSALSTAQINLAGKIAEHLSEQARAAYNVGYEHGWNAGWEARDELPPAPVEAPHADT